MVSAQYLLQLVNATVLTVIGECKRYILIAMGWLFLWLLRMLQRVTDIYGGLTMGHSSSCEGNAARHYCRAVHLREVASSKTGDVGIGVNI